MWLQSSHQLYSISARILLKAKATRHRRRLLEQVYVSNYRTSVVKEDNMELSSCSCNCQLWHDLNCQSTVYHVSSATSPSTPSLLPTPQAAVFTVCNKAVLLFNSSRDATLLCSGQEKKQYEKVGNVDSLSWFSVNKCGINSTLTGQFFGMLFMAALVINLHTYYQFTLLSK